MKSHPSDDIIDLLTRFLQNGAGNEEKEQAMEWINKSESNKEYFENLKQIYHSSEEIEDFDKIDLDQQWQVFKHNNVKAKKSGLSYSYLFKIAAALVVVLSLGYLLNNSLYSDVHLIAGADTIQEYRLPDNSVIWLNRNSELIYSRNSFNEQNREVTLIGEAFFDVAKDSLKPFVINANDTKVRVLGTSFNLKTSKDSGVTELVLVTGKVEFSNKVDQVILQPGEIVSTDASHKITKQDNEDLNFMSWKSGVLKFESTPLIKVFKDLEIFYNKEITIDNQGIVDCTLTTTFDNQSMESVIEELKLLFDFTITTQNSDKIWVTGGSCN